MSTNNTLSPKRLDWIDMARGIAVFIVIIGHLYINKKLVNVIYSFHMPLFFIISGLTFNKEKVANMPIFEYAKKTFKRLVVPYFWLQFLSFPLWYYVYPVMKYSSSSKCCDFGRNFIGIFISHTDYYKNPSRATWFFLTMFLSLIGYRIVLKIAKNDKFKELCLVAICLLISYADKRKSIPWHLNTAFTGIVFIYIGTYLIKFLNKYEKLKVSKTNIPKICARFFLIVLSALICCWLVKQNGKASMAINKFGNQSVLIFYICAVVFSLIVLIVARFLPNIKPISYIGKNTLVVVAMHKHVSQAICCVWNYKEQSLWFQLLVALGLFIIFIPITALVNKTGPYIAGNPNKGGLLIEVFKYIYTMIAACIPVYYFCDKIGLSNLYIVGAITAILSVVFVLIFNKFFPIFFGKDKKVSV